MKVGFIYAVNEADLHPVPPPPLLQLHGDRGEERLIYAPAKLQLCQQRALAAEDSL